jgi:3-hydroxybutyryl-CoA dehydrogenase
MQPKDIDRVAVVGAGLMGHGIALQFALGGRDVWLNDLTEDALSRAMDSVRTSMGTLQAVGLVDGDAVVQALERVHTEVSLDKALSGAGLVIEAVFEDLDLKRSVFKRLDAVSGGAAILASNTSSFMASQLAPETEHPERVVVANWWNPPYLLPLVEVVPGPNTASETVDTLCGILSAVGKSPVVLRKESLGFIGNRMQFALLREAVSIVEQGIASAEDVDTVVKTSFGRRLSVAGPLEVFDIAGWDTITAIVDQLFPEIERSPDTPAILRGMVDRGELGLKSGRGFYPWTEESAASVRGRVAQALATLEGLSRGDG